MSDFEVTSAKTGFRYLLSADAMPSDKEIDDYVRSQDETLRKHGRNAFAGTETFALNKDWKPRVEPVRPYDIRTAPRVSARRDPAKAIPAPTPKKDFLKLGVDFMKRNAPKPSTSKALANVAAGEEALRHGVLPSETAPPVHTSKKWEQAHPGEHIPADESNLFQKAIGYAMWAVGQGTPAGKLITPEQTIKHVSKTIPDYVADRLMKAPANEIGPFGLIPPKVRAAFFGHPAWQGPEEAMAVIQNLSSGSAFAAPILDYLEKAGIAEAAKERGNPGKVDVSYRGIDAETSWAGIAQKHAPGSAVAGMAGEIGDLLFPLVTAMFGKDALSNKASPEFDAAIDRISAREASKATATKSKQLIEDIGKPTETAVKVPKIGAKPDVSEPGAKLQTHVIEIDPHEIGVKPGIQYKSDLIDFENAVTGAMKSIKNYDIDQGGIITVWRDKSGKLWVVNGHHRLELAKRAERFVQVGPDDIHDAPARTVRARILDENEGWTLERARGRGALENIRDEKGKGIDAVTALRDLGISVDDFERYGISVKGNVARNTAGLMGVDEAALGPVRTGHVTEDAAAGLGSVPGLTREQQIAGMDALRQVGNKSYDEGVSLGKKLIGAQIEKSQGGFEFGKEFEQHISNLALEAKVEDLAKKALAKERSALLQPVGAEELAGEKIDVATRKALAEQYGKSRAETVSRVEIILDNDPEIRQNVRRLGKAVADGDLSAEAAAAELAGIVRSAAQNFNLKEVVGRGQAASVRVPGGERGLPRPDETATGLDEGTAPLFSEQHVPEVHSDLSTGDVGTYLPTRTDARILLVDGNGKLWLNLKTGKTVGPVDAAEFKVQGRLFEGPKVEAAPEELVLTAPEGPKTSSSADQGALFSSGERAPLESPAKGATPATTVAKGAAPSAEPMRLKDVKFEMGEEFAPKILTRKQPRANVLGHYGPYSGHISIRFEGDLPTTAHEIAHALDDRFGAMAEWAGKRVKSPYDAELFQPEFMATQVKSWTLDRRRAESVAEFVRRYVLDPQATEALAPQFTAYIRAKLPPKVWERVEKFGSDVRQWQEQSASAKVAGQIQIQGPPKKTVPQQVAGFFEKSDPNQPYKSRLIDTAFRAHLTDEIAPFVAGVEETLARQGKVRLYPNLHKLADKGMVKVPAGARSVVMPADDPVLLARQLPYFTNKMDDILKNGMRDATGHVVTPPVAKILESLDTTTRETLERDLRDTMAMMVSERVVEKASIIMKEARQAADRVRAEALAIIERAGGKTSNLSPAQVQQVLKLSNKAEKLEKAAALRVERIGGFGGGIYSDVKVAEQALVEMASNPERYKAMQEAATRYREFADAGLDYAVQKGLISRVKAQQIRAKNEFYANMGRVMEDETGVPVRSRGMKPGSGKNPLKKFKGSTREIDSPFVNMVSDVFLLIKEADRNEIMRKWRDVLTVDRGMYQGKPIDLSSIGHKVKQGEPGAIRILVDGKAEHWVFEKGIHDVLTDLGNTWAPGWVEAMIQLPGSTLRWSVTHTVPYAIRNFLRDAQHRMKVSRTQQGALPEAFRLMKALKPTAAEKSDYNYFGAGIGRGHYLERAPDWYAVQRQVLHEAAADKGSVLLLPVKGWNWYEDMIGASEKAGRIVEVRSALDAAKKAGLDEYNAKLYAAGQSRELLDFARGGKVTKFINRYVPFVNARVQGLTRWATAAAEDPGKATAAFLKYSVIPTLAVYYWNRANGNLEEYQQLPNYQRDLFFNFKIGNDMWLRIPKDYESGVMAAAVERTIDKMLGNEHAFDGAAGQAIRTLLPLDESEIGGLMQGIIEVLANYDFFRQKNIIPPYEDQLDLELRKTGNASRLGQFLQDALNVDARKADNFLLSQFADIGRVATMVSDVGREGKNSSTRVLNQMFGVFTGSPVTASQDVQWVQRTAAGRGVSGGPEVKKLRELLDVYYQAKDGAERDQAGQAVRAYASKVREEWDFYREQGPAEKALRDEYRKLQVDGKDEERRGQQLADVLKAISAARNEAIKVRDMAGKTEAEKKAIADRVKKRIEEIAGRFRDMAPAGASR